MSLVAAAAAAVVVVAEFEGEVEVASEASELSLQEVAWEPILLFQVLGGCLRDEALEAGL